MNKKVVIIGAGINGLIAANYLSRAGFEVHLIEKKNNVGGACVSESITLNESSHQYALGASVLGLMQRFIFEETGLSKYLETFVPMEPKLVYFPEDNEPTKIYRNPEELDQ